MYNILTLNKISKLGLSQLDSEIFACSDSIENPDGIVVRSASMHDMEFGKNLKAIARAGAGVNNIPIDKCTQEGIVVFNTPGANANAVKELVLAALLLASRDVVGAVDWAKTLVSEGENVPKLVEKGKSNFAGPEISGKTLGVIGLGAIGVMVANAAYHLGMNVLGYDPYISVDAAWGLSRFVHKAESLDEIFADCDYITVHVPLNDGTKNMVNEQSISKMKNGVCIINMARGELVNNQAIISALESGKVARYVTDFPNSEVLNIKGIIPIPHLGASTPESEENCAVMACREISDFLLHGNITHSVNLPDVSMPNSDATRVCVIHKNIPNMISQITTAMGNSGVNIENLLNKSKKDYAYTMLDISSANDSIKSAIEAIEGVISVRVIG